MSKYKNLFLQQSYYDQYDTYLLALEQGVPQWDYLVLTASNEKQAQAYRDQIAHRLADGKLPAQTQYLVLPDPGGMRVGSGGATLNVLAEIAKARGSANFAGVKILCIHSGGDSKRVPQYSACGKLFSPVPRMLPDGRRSTLFDEFIIGMSLVPSRMTDGMLLCSGDVLLLFNPLQIDFYGKGAAAFSIKEQVATAKNHGVYLADEDGNVGSFLHKKTEATLAARGAVDKSGNCNIDTGLLIFDSNILNDLYRLIDTDEKFASLVNEEVRLSLYADFSYPLASGATLAQYYMETPEGELNDALHDARTLVWNVLSSYRMKLIRFAPAAFIHFGTTRELLQLMTEELEGYCYLGWSAQVNSNSKATHFAVSNAYISRRATVGEGSYIEDSYLHRGVHIGKGCVVSGVTLKETTVPDGVVLHGLKLGEDCFVVRCYGVQDNPKEALHFGKPIAMPLWDAPLFPVCSTIAQAVEQTLAIVGIGSSNAMAEPVAYGNVCKDNVQYLSLKESFALADISAILPWQEKLDDKVKAETLLEAIEKKVPAEQVVGIFPAGVSERVKQHLLYEASLLDERQLDAFSTKIRIYYYLYKLFPKCSFAKQSFATICDAILQQNLARMVYHPEYRIAQDETVLQLPVRVNFGGGWSDTPPYCNEHGGTVLNAAILLHGEYPIEVTIRKTDAPTIALASTDIGSYQEFTSLVQLQDCTNPSDAFALHKAALIACGVIPYTGGSTVQAIVQQLGGGIYLNTRVRNIPKGSGLGTSSILAGACVKAIHAFLGQPVQDDLLYAQVLCMEQLMSTGGGWQDQVGGLTSGIKMITTEPGLDQTITCTPLHVSERTMQQLQQRFAIIYTGQRRLARNLLREVMGKYIGATPDSVMVLYEIQRMAVLMRFALEKGDVDGFAQLLSEHWALSKKLDRGCTNTCIDQVFLAIDDLIDGKMICGAGGGGFLQVVLKEGVPMQVLKNRLDEVFSDSGVAVWESQFC